MAKKLRKSDVYVATESFSADIDGNVFVARKGITRVRAGHPVLERCPMHFEPVGDNLDYELEAATAAPGEKR